MADSGEDAEKTSTNEVPLPKHYCGCGFKYTADNWKDYKQQHEQRSEHHQRMEAQEIWTERKNNVKVLSEKSLIDQIVLLATNCFLKEKN